jgi:hypothetical protein
VHCVETAFRSVAHSSACLMILSQLCVIRIHLFASPRLGKWSCGDLELAEIGSWKEGLIFSTASKRIGLLRRWRELQAIEISWGVWCGCDSGDGLRGACQLRWTRRLLLALGKVGVLSVKPRRLWILWGVRFCRRDGCCGGDCWGACRVCSSCVIAGYMCFITCWIGFDNRHHVIFFSGSAVQGYWWCTYYEADEVQGAWHLFTWNHYWCSLFSFWSVSVAVVLRCVCLPCFVCLWMIDSCSCFVLVKRTFLFRLKAKRNLRRLLIFCENSFTVRRWWVRAYHFRFLRRRKDSLVLWWNSIAASFQLLIIS